MPLVQRGAGILVPQGAGDLIDQIRIDLGRDQPQRGDGQRLGGRQIAIGALGDRAGLEERVVLQHLVHRRSGQRHQPYRQAFRQFGNGGGRGSGDQEQRVDLTLDQLVNGGARLQIDRLHAFFCQAIRLQQDQAVDQRAGALLAQRDPLAAQILDRFDTGIGTHHEMHRLVIQAGDGAQRLAALLALEDAGTVQRRIGDIGLAEARFDLAPGNLPDILDRAAGGLGQRDETGHATAAAAVTRARAGRAADHIGNGGADREIGAAGRPGGDAEELRLLRPHAVAGAEQEGAGPQCHEADRQNTQQPESGQPEQPRAGAAVGNGRPVGLCRVVHNGRSPYLRPGAPGCDALTRTAKAQPLHSYSLTRIRRAFIKKA